jgi:hypothetical protein
MSESGSPEPAGCPGGAQVEVLSERPVQDFSGAPLLSRYDGSQTYSQLIALKKEHAKGQETTQSGRLAGINCSSQKGNTKRLLKILEPFTIQIIIKGLWSLQQ